MNNKLLDDVVALRDGLLNKAEKLATHAKENVNDIDNIQIDQIIGRCLGYNEVVLLLTDIIESARKSQVVALPGKIPGGINNLH